MTYYSDKIKTITVELNVNSKKYSDNLVGKLKIFLQRMGFTETIDRVLLSDRLIEFDGEYSTTTLDTVGDKVETKFNKFKTYYSEYVDDPDVDDDVFDNEELMITF